MNVAIITGRLAADPELKTTQSGVSVTSVTLAVDRYSKEERKTDWVDVVAWRGTAEFICKYFSKGQMMSVTGSIQTRRWEDKQGNKRKAVEVLAHNVEFVGSKSDNAKSQQQEPDSTLPETAPLSQDEMEEILGADDLQF